MKPPFAKIYKTETPDFEIDAFPAMIMIDFNGDTDIVRASMLKDDAIKAAKAILEFYEVE